MILCVALPMLVAILEMGLMIHEALIFESYSSQIPMTVSRSCANLAGAQADACQDGILNASAAAIANSVPWFAARGNMAASIFQWNANTGAVQQVSSRAVGGGGLGSRFTAATMNAALVQAHGTVYVGEVTSARLRVFPVLPIDWLVGLVGFPRSLYECTLI